MKFNVGDKFLNLKDLDMVNNVFHGDRCIEYLIKTVNYANEKYFSNHKTSFIGGTSAGIDKGITYNQEDGESISCDSTMLHLVKDSAILTTAICDSFSSEINEIAETFNEEKEGLISKIIHMQKELSKMSITDTNKIDGSGTRCKYGCSFSINELQNRKNKILKMITED